LSRLGKGYPADRVIPLAFHVDYWNYLGWSDRFSTPEFTERQKDQALRQRSKLVYTPQVFVDSHDFRGWRDAGSLRKEVERINAHPPTVRLALAAEGAGNGKLTVQVQASPLPKSSGATPPVYLALYETGLESQVTAGENKDVHLRHDFVVRELLGPFAPDAAGMLTTQRTLELPADLNPAHAGLVAFTDSDRANGSRQALALALDHCLSDK
jgi:hypothetical protein